MNSDFLNTLFLTGKLAISTTLILLIIALPIGYWLTYSKFKFKAPIEAFICMPMVLPPTVMGYYLLVAFSPENILGSFLDQYLNTRWAFSFQGILIASILAGLPFMVQPIQNGFSSLPKSYKEASYTLGKSSWVTFYKVLVPNIKSSIITGVALTFAHCIGEFGIVLMVGGNIPGQTRIASIAIYDEVQALNYPAAHQYSLVLFIISFFLLVLIYSINKNFKMNTL
ncbi:molybdate ABC transporter permease subunit [Apibacter muscae]|uniref:molybdate ABC transporter permease subunit n=1 Tax=Apibacter muscae TaxID=2509004 RepID=UPI0011ADA0D9|nr:molybdate ABC transporter permease subunit [Apibacter muscae]TWP23781.1 molybdate ABC transporter permease subunit [Apibacter muscae]